MNKNISTPLIIGAGAGLVALATMHSAGATTVSPAKQTCAAFRAWEGHRTGANLDKIVTASFTVTWRYLGLDAVNLYADVRDHASAHYINSEVQYLKQDCASAHA